MTQPALPTTLRRLAHTLGLCALLLAPAQAATLRVGHTASAWPHLHW